MGIGRRLFYIAFSVIISLIIMFALGETTDMKELVTTLWLPEEVIKTIIFLLLSWFIFHTLKYSASVTRDWRTKIN